MVHGIDKYRDYFLDYPGHYILIGGAACDILMTDIGVEFRATKDFDVVLIAEAFSEDFFRALWQFINDGGYKNRQKSSGREQFYRFTEPVDRGFPAMIELFSRKPLNISIREKSILTPIPTGQGIPSLSAILVDKIYYDLLLEGANVIDGISILREE